MPPVSFLSLIKGKNGSRRGAAAGTFSADELAAAPLSSPDPPLAVGARGAAFFVAFAFGLLACGDGWVCAADIEAKQNTTIAIVANHFVDIFASIIVVAYRLAGAGAETGFAWTSAACVKKVVIVKVPVTEDPGVIRNFEPLLPIAANFKSPTLIILESRPSRAKKSSTE